MKIMAFVGSPRKNSNIDTLIDKVIEGAKSKIDAEVEKIYLYEAILKTVLAVLPVLPLRGVRSARLKMIWPAFFSA